MVLPFRSTRAVMSPWASYSIVVPFFSVRVKLLSGLRTRVEKLPGGVNKAIPAAPGLKAVNCQERI